MPVKIRFTNQGVIEEYIKKDSGELPEVFFEVDAFDKDGNALAGGGLTTIADGGTIGGVYNGDVLCQGAVTMDDDVVVAGDLTVLGIFTNDTGRALTVFGDLKTFGNVEFNRANTALPQSAIGVYGDWHAGGSAINFIQSGGAPASIYVGGDFLGTQGGGPTTDLYAYGLAGNSGANVIVQGDLYMYRVDLDGGSSDATVAGNGGSITVYGNFHTGNDVDCRGGYSSTVGVPGGQGGNLLVYGNFNCGDDFRNNGGDADSAAAGSAGFVEVYGDMIVDDDFQSWGGAASIGSGGSGASVHIYGDLVCGDQLNLAGGSGTLGGSAGFLLCGGNVTLDGVNLEGGNGTAGAGGTGGWMQVYGNANSRSALQLSAGNSTGTSSGANCSQQTGNFAPACLWVLGDLNASAIYASGGSAAGTGAGGNGGIIEVGGDLNVANTVVLSGGDSAAGGNGGNAGAAYVFGSLNVILSVSLNGGNAQDATAYNGGYGGALLVTGFAKAGSIQIAGGNATAAMGTHGSPGALTLRGGAACSELTFIDGFGGAAAAPPETCYVKLSGNCTISNLNVTDRAQILVVPGDAGDPPAILKINEISGPGGYSLKSTLNDRTSGLPSSSITALVGGSLFISDLGGSWYSITGTSLFGP